MAEEWIIQVADEADCFAGGFHFRPQLFVHFGEFIKRKYRFLNRITFQLAVNCEVFQFVGSEHHFGGNIDERHIVCLCDKRYGPRSTGRSEEHTSELQSLMRISYAV